MAFREDKDNNVRQVNRLIGFFITGAKYKMKKVKNEKKSRHLFDVLADTSQSGNIVFIFAIHFAV